MKQHEEIVGFLKGSKKENGEITLIFEIQKEIEIPPGFEEKIKKYIGKTVGIFFLDNSYFFRVIGGDENETNQTKEQRKKPTV